MSFQHSSVREGVSLALLAVAAGTGAAQTEYVATVLNSGNLPPGFSFSVSQDGTGGQQAGYIFQSDSPYSTHAATWDGTPNGVIDLHPPQYFETLLEGSDGATQAGTVKPDQFSEIRHAMYWQGTAASAVDLHPAAGPFFDMSNCRDVDGDTQVGQISGLAIINVRAAMWHGTAASWTSLHPIPGYVQSGCNAIRGNMQVGFGNGSGTSGSNEALLWLGTPESAVNLNPQGYRYSEAHGCDDVRNQQCGWAEKPPSPPHAMLWSGSAESAVDLNSPGIDQSYAQDVWNHTQVGFGRGELTEFYLRALAWHDTPTSVISLHQFLPAEYLGSSAWGIGRDGVIVGDCSTESGTFACYWTAVTTGVDSEAPEVTDFGWSRIAPQPSTEQTSLRFRTASPGSIQLTIVGADGRLVRRLFNGTLPAGEQNLRWDIRDDAGRRVAAGAYFARIESGGRARSARVIVGK